MRVYVDVITLEKLGKNVYSEGNSDGSHAICDLYLMLLTCKDRNAIDSKLPALHHCVMGNFPRNRKLTVLGCSPLLFEGRTCC
jgi:hypothetical protein